LTQARGPGFSEESQGPPVWFSNCRTGLICPEIHRQIEKCMFLSEMNIGVSCAEQYEWTDWWGSRWGSPAHDQQDSGAWRHWTTEDSDPVIPSSNCQHL
jgi:hypothetical protein